ncbi:MAG: hypothetical protein NVS9B15_06400 [Acidobacteriaceae bacterium]
MVAGSVSALAQVNVMVKGKAVDAQGKPIVGAKVEMINKDNGRKFNMKTGKDGSFMNIGISPGTYSATLTGADGKVLSKADNFKADPGAEENTLNFDIQAEQKETQAIVSGEKKVEPSKMTEEQRKALEAAQKQQEEVKNYNAKVGNLNQLLQQARADNKAGNYAEAMSVMNQAIQTDPNQALLYGTLADSQSGAKDYKSCADNYGKAIDLLNAKKPDPSTTSIWSMGRGMCLAHTGDVAGAKAAIDKAAQENPQIANMAYFNEGAIFTNTGKIDDANAAYDKAIAADPAKPDAYFRKGQNLMQKATMDKAGKIVPAPGTEEALQKYVELAPDGKYAPEAKDMLAGLGAKVETSFGKKKK